MPLTIKKVLNSSVVLIEDETQNESIVIGKGIGYGSKRGEQIQQKDVDQLFVPIQTEEQKQILALLEEISPKVVDTTAEIIRYVNRTLQKQLTKRLSFALMDHIDFALQRYRNHLNIQNKLYWEVQTYYPDEFEVSEKSVALINRRFNVQLPKAEAANIAFHIINAEQDDADDYDSLKVTELVDDIINLIRYQAHKDLSYASISYQRLVTHVKFFVDRLFADKQLDSDDDIMNFHLQEKYPEATRIANLICTFIQRKYNLTVSDEEFTFLVVHIERNIK